MNGVDLQLPLDCLAIFLDETGHETLATGHSVYGIGGCAVMPNELETFVRGPWRKIREALTGSPDSPLHAAEVTRVATAEQQALIGAFFRQNSFRRVAVAVHSNARTTAASHRLNYMAPCLMKRILEVLNWTTARSVALIFEANPRTQEAINSAFGSISVGEDGTNLPIQGFFMPKSANEPALEVTDFIMHAVHGLARDFAAGRDGYKRRDFQSVFKSVDRRLASFMLINSVIQSER